MSTRRIAAFVFHAASRTRRLWLVALALLVLGAAYGGRSAQRVLAQTAPPGPQLAAGDFINPDNRVRTATWEAFPADNALGEVLYIWTTTYVSRAYPCSSDSGVGPACFAWTQYFWNPIDAYNTGLWTPFQRGCMLLGDDPFNVGEADGVSVITDIYAAGTTYIAVNRATESVATLNPLSPGFAASPGAAALAAMTPWPCGGGGSLAGSGGGCSSWAGTWSTSYGTMQLSQSGSSVIGTYEDNGGRIAGTASGSVLSGTWSEQPSYTPPDDAGDFQFTMSADGTSFSGGWRYGSSGSFTTDWTGTRSCSGTPSSGGGTQGPARSGTISGTWDANNGVYTFTQNGNSVSASIAFSGGLGSATLQGTINGNTVQSTWQCNSDCPVPGSHGTVTLTVSSNRCSMQGSYVSMVGDMQTGTGPLTMTKRGCSG